MARNKALDFGRMRRSAKVEQIETRSDLLVGILSMAHPAIQADFLPVIDQGSRLVSHDGSRMITLCGRLLPLGDHTDCARCADRLERYT